MFDFIYFETKKLGFAKRENCLDGVPVLLVLKHTPIAGAHHHIELAVITAARFLPITIFIGIVIRANNQADRNSRQIKILSQTVD